MCIDYNVNNIFLKVNVYMILRFVNSFALKKISLLLKYGPVL